MHPAHGGTYHDRHQTGPGIGPLLGAPVGQSGEEPAHPAQRFRTLRTFRNLSLRQRLQGRGEVAPPQNRARSRPQFPHPKLLGPLVGHVGILPGSPVALRLPQERPAAGLVARPPKPLAVDKTLRHQHRVPVDAPPIRRPPLPSELHHPAGQVRHPPLRPKQKPAVVHPQRQPAPLLAHRPPNPRFPVLPVEGRRAPRQSGHPWAAILRHVAQLLPDPIRTAQVVLAADQLVESLTSLRIACSASLTRGFRCWLMPATVNECAAGVTPSVNPPPSL